MEPAKPERLK